jgi:hypothetical protein
MSAVHSKKTFVSVAGVDLSEFTDSSEIPRARATHNITGYGMDDERHSKGLKSGTFKMSGHYDNTESTGPRAVLLDEFDDEVTESVEVIRRGEGTGAGKPQDKFDAIIENYTESNPLADMVKWSCDFKITGPVDTTPQSA